MMTFLVFACLVPWCFRHLLSTPLNPTPALGALPFQRAAHVSGDPQLRTTPHSVHLAREVGGKLW